MVGKCANSRCPAPRHHHEGTLFRLDIDLGNKAGGDERQTEYMWLCDTPLHGLVHKTLGNGITVSICQRCMKSIASSTPTRLRMAEENHHHLCGSRSRKSS